METKIRYGEKDYKAIPGFDKYYVSSTGEVLSFVKDGGTPAILRRMKRKDGYKYVFLYRNKKQEKMYIHHAVLLSWVGPRPEGTEGRHLDDCQDNNDYRNLAWGTRQENVDDKKRNGRIRCGEATPMHKITSQQALEIRSLYGKMPIREIGLKYGISHTQVRRIAVGKKWKHLEETKC